VALAGPDSLLAQVERVRLAGMQSGAARVLPMMDGLIEAVAERGGARTAREFVALARALRTMGREDPSAFKDALATYDRAIALDSLDLAVRAELGALFVEKFNYADARRTLQAVRAINPREPRALAALAALDVVDPGPPGEDAVAQLLAVDPRNAVGRTFAARRLIDAEQYDEAVREARHGLALDSLASAPWIAIAAAHWLAHDSVAFRAALARAHVRLPGAATAEVTLAEVAARNRLYRDAVHFAQAGVARDSLDSRAFAVLGINLLRVGDPVGARAALTRAFAGDPYDVWVKNTLDLLDAYATARTVATPHFDLVIESSDAELLSLHAAPLAEDAWTALTARYGYVPPERVRVEFFRSHADFSVRAVGLAGLGALGVAFGPVLAIDAPPARARGDFNWAAVLWHEFAHTITLGMTANRVPRWVSEGLSVHEERRARGHWGGAATPTLIAAYGAGRLRPVSQLNDGFVRPRFADEVILSYALAAYVFEMLEERRGIDGIRALLTGYRDGGRTPELMQRVYALTPAALDSTFDAWFRARFASEFAAVRGELTTGPDGAQTVTLAGPLRGAVAAATVAAERSAWREVIPAAERAVALFPGHVTAGSGHHLLATASLALGDTARAIGALTAITARNGEAIEENLQLAALLEARRDTAGAAGALARAVEIDPYDARVQTRLATVAAARRDWPNAIRARRALVALGPADRAEALYRLAQVLSASGDQVGARREVLKALDLAPTYEAAQELLLTIRSGSKTP
jgi:tetratricopeptide (TPR) repeat protein